MTTETHQAKAEATAIRTLMMSPNDLTVIGVDTTDGPEHYLWDPRIELPVDRTMVDSIKKFGVFTPVLAQSDGPRSLIIEGRRRILHARVACRELTAEGREPIKVPVLFKRGDDKTIVGISNSANAQRVQDSPLINAYKAQRGLDMGKSLADLCIEFGVTEDTITKSWLPLLDLHPEVKAKLHTKEIGVNAGLALTQVPRDEQVQILSDIKAEAPGAKPSAARVNDKVRQKQGKAPSKTPSIRIAKMRETLTRFVKKGPDAATKEELMAVLSTLCSLATDASLAKFQKRVELEQEE